MTQDAPVPACERVSSCRHALLTQRFVPEVGGAIQWMLEVYRRWPVPVDVVAHDYYNAPHGRPEFPGRPQRPPAGDHVVEPRLRMDRRDIFMHDWGLEHPGSLVRHWRMMRAVAERATPGQRLVVHCTHAVPEALSLIPLKWRLGERIKIVSYAHGEEITSCDSSRQLRWLMRRANAAVDLMIANSQNTARLLRPHIDPAKVRIVHPGVDLSAYERSAELGRAWRREQGLDNELIVLSIGRLDARKNQAAVLEALPRLLERFPNTVYVIAGDGGLRDVLRRRAEELGVAERTRFLGSVGGELKTALYGACDIFAMPAVQVGTDVEGFGLVFLEAAACGKPSVAGSAGGQPEAVIDGQTGVVVDGRDVGAVAGALIRLAGDAELRARMGAAGRERAAGFDWPLVAGRVVHLVEQLLAGSLSETAPDAIQPTATMLDN